MAQKQKSAAAAALFLFSMDRGWRSEVIVDADLTAVDVQRAKCQTRRELGKEGRAAKAAEEIFSLQRPARHEHPFDAGARCPADLGLAVAKRYAKSGDADLVVGQREATSAVKQDLIERDADSAANRRQSIDLCRQSDWAERRY